ncbi:MAG TPA: dihydrolipoyl dehydrogenase [Clostridiaceae bacterium]|jgi:dihydrolipoamide dehydrogenase|nr:dihydrolipoyl dehydrogenase [Clostridiaceae bacterium]
MIYDLIVIGGGPAGYLAAERAGQAGLNVICFEKSSVGGVCLNEGCIPTKTMLYSAKLYDGVANGERYGITSTGLSIDHGKVLARKNKVVRMLVSGVKTALKSSNVVLVEAEAVITEKNHQGYIVSANGSAYTGKRVLIATGSSPAIPPVPGISQGLEAGFVITSKEALNIAVPPGKLVVIGGGIIGLEMAAYYNSIGTDVTVIEMLDHIGGENDIDLVKILQKNYEKKGIKFYLSSKVTEIGNDEVVFEKDGQSQKVSADKVLLSVGRRPNISGIGIENINILTERGAIITDEKMQTNQPGVYAAGDVTGKSMLAHTAYREAEVAVNNMLGKKDVMQYTAIPSVIYTNPELASVGETEATARAKGMDIDTVKISMRYSGRYLAENEGGDGMAKLILDRESKTVLGAQVLANYSSEFIVACGTFIERGLTVDEIKKIVFPHPTVSEIIRDAIFQY